MARLVDDPQIATASVAEIARLARCQCLFSTAGHAVAFSRRSGMRATACPGQRGLQHAQQEPCAIVPCPGNARLSVPCAFPAVPAKVDHSRLGRRPPTAAGSEFHIGKGGPSHGSPLPLRRVFGKPVRPRSKGFMQGGNWGHGHSGCLHFLFRSMQKLWQCGWCRCCCRLARQDRRFP